MLQNSKRVIAWIIQIVDSTFVEDMRRLQDACLLVTSKIQA